MSCPDAKHLRGRREGVSMNTVASHTRSKMLPTEMVCKVYFDLENKCIFFAVRILTSTAEVKKFLDGFSKLKGYTITDNQHAKPGGGLFNKFKQKWNSLPKSQRVTCLAFHGTTEKNIPNICQNGYDPKLRSGQVYGKGEYFATTPDVPIQYCRGGKKILLNELLLGQQNVHHTKQSVSGSTYIVMKYPEHDLPRFVVTFK